MSITNELVQEAQSGNRKSMDEVIEGMKLMIFKLAGKFSRNHPEITYDDFVQQGFMAVWKAVGRFDTNKKVKFVSYATECIQYQLCYLLRPVKKKIEKKIKFSLDRFDSSEFNYKKIIDCQGYYTNEQIQETLEEIRKLLPLLEMTERGKKRKEIFELYYLGKFRIIWKEISKKYGQCSNHVQKEGSSVVKWLKKALADPN